MATVRAAFSWIGWVGWLTVLIKPLNAGLSMAGDVDLLANYFGPIGKFLDTGWGTSTSIVAGAAIIGYAIYQRSQPEPIGVANQTTRRGEAFPINHPNTDSRYMTAYEALHYLADDSDWGNQTRKYISADGMRKNVLLEAPVEFQRAAQHGGIHAVGRLNGIGQHVPIPETFWMTATLGPFSRLNRDISDTTPTVPNRDGLPRYESVMIVREDVERTWPRSAPTALSSIPISITRTIRAIGVGRGRSRT